MSVVIRRLEVSKPHRLRNKWQMGHKPSGFGHGKWQSRDTLFRYKRLSRRRRRMAAASRRRNRVA